jgi:hypothetical protein
MQRGDLLDNAKCGQIEVTVAIPPAAAAHNASRDSLAKSKAMEMCSRVVSSMHRSRACGSRRPRPYLSPS